MGLDWWTFGVCVSSILVYGGGGCGRVLAVSLPGMTPDQTCKHNMASSYATGKPPLIDTPLYSLRINQTKYVPGQPIRVTISGPPFKGFILQARKYQTKSNVGTFQAPAADTGADLKRCQRQNDTMSAWFSTPRQNVTYTWTAPEDDLGTIHFVGTIFQDEKRFWTNITSHSFRKGFAPIDLSQCGTKKGCFRYTKSGETSCQPDTCMYLLTYEVHGPHATFEISAVADWAAVGFSSDNQMGGDDVFMCVRTHTGSGADVHHYSNDYAHQAPSKKDRNPLFNTDVEVIDSNGEKRISCRFQRDLKIHNDMSSVDLNNDWYQLYAWGPVSASDTLMRHYLDSPPTSETKLTLFRKGDVISGASTFLYGRGLTIISLIVAKLFGRWLIQT
jgi:hypothetical protein